MTVAGRLVVVAVDCLGELTSVGLRLVDCGVVYIVVLDCRLVVATVVGFEEVAGVGREVVAVPFDCEVVDEDVIDNMLVCADVTGVDRTINGDFVD